MPITALWLKKTVDFIGASRLCGKRERQGFAHQGQFESWTAEGLFNEDLMMWDGEGVLSLRWHFKGCSALALQQLWVKVLLPLGTDWEKGDMKYGKINCRRKGGNCFLCARWVGLKVASINYIQVIWSRVGFTCKYLLSQGGIQPNPAQCVCTFTNHPSALLSTGMSILLLWLGVGVSQGQDGSCPRRGQDPLSLLTIRRTQCD